MRQETLTCPHCLASVTSANTSELPGMTVARCKTCQEKYVLSHARAAVPKQQMVPQQQLAPQQPRTTQRPQGNSHISTSTVDVPYRQMIATQVVVNHESNGLGVAAFVTALVALLTVGCLSPIALIFSLVAINKPPRGMAIAGLVLSIVGMIPLALLAIPFLFALVIAANMPEDGGRNSQRSATSSSFSPAKSGTVVATNVKQIKTPTGNTRVTMDLENKTSQSIKRIEIVVKFYEGAQREPFAQGASTYMLDNAIAPGVTQQFSFAPSVGSQLRPEFPSNIRGEAEIVSALDSSGQLIPLTN